MTKEQAIEALKLIQATSQGVEDDHVKADTILCQFLQSIGHGDLVEQYDKIDKVYA